MTLSELGHTALFMLFGPLVCCAQTSIASAYGAASSGNHSLTYSIGQVFYQGNEGFSISQGVQIPFEQFETTSVEEKGLDKGVMLYPNPSDGDIWLKVDHPAGAELVILDAAGKEHLRQSAKEHQHISLSHLISGMYVLRLSGHNSANTSIKFILR